MTSRTTLDVDSETPQREFRSVLDEFREHWQRELQTEQVQPVDAGVDIDEEPAINIIGSDADRAQTQAESLYRKAVELEQRGKVYDALPYYRKAMQIVPDIEFKFYEQQKLNNDVNKKFHNLPTDLSKLDIGKDNDDAEETEHIDDLYDKFQHDLCSDLYGGKLMLNSRETGVLQTGLHISDLPREIVMHILRWVVSSQLDMRSLEQCSAVSKGFYVYARDEELWRLACVKVWGHNVGTLDKQEEHGDAGESSYYSWRDMFIRRERVVFSGCYISKTTYLRMGENSFQDQFYRPVQLVEYYRYIRFLPDGKALMMTSAEEPAQGVGKLKQLQSLRPDVLRGHYRLFGNSVTLLMQKAPGRQPAQQTYMRQRRGSVMPAEEDANNTQYVVELRIIPSPKRRFAQLVWTHYTLVQKRNKVETTTEFDLTAAKYPPLWFSPVKSYHLDADAPLA